MVVRLGSHDHCFLFLVGLFFVVFPLFSAAPFTSQSDTTGTTSILGHILTAAATRSCGTCPRAGWLVCSSSEYLAVTSMSKQEEEEVQGASG